MDNVQSQMSEANADIITIDYEPAREFPPMDNLTNYCACPKPFFIVLTSGIEYIDRIRTELGLLGISVESEHDIVDFENFARHIYPIMDEKPHTHVWLMLNRYFYGDHPQGRALILPSHFIGNYDVVAQAKRKIRKTIGMENYTVSHNGHLVQVTFHHLHAPDIEELSYQYNCLLNYSNLSEEA